MNRAGAAQYLEQILRTQPVDQGARSAEVGQVELVELLLGGRELGRAYLLSGALGDKPRKHVGYLLDGSLYELVADRHAPRLSHEPRSVRSLAAAGWRCRPRASGAEPPAR